jgi:hypothetical protein
MKKIYNENQLPVFEFIIDEEDERALSKIALTANPAIELKGKYFSKEIEYQMFSDEEKQIIAGPAMIPNIKIKRKDENGNLYMGYFTKETIAKMVEIFNKNLKDKPQGVINDEHSENMVDAYIVGSWIVEDSYYDKSKFYGYDLPVGTWFMEVKVEDKDFWNKGVKEEGKYGFSIEGIMDIIFKGKGDRFSKVDEEWFSVLKEIGWLDIDDDFLNFLDQIRK